MRFWLVRNWTWSLKLVRSSEKEGESKVWYFKGVGHSRGLNSCSLIGHGLGLQFSLLLLTRSSIPQCIVEQVLTIWIVEMFAIVSNAFIVVPLLCVSLSCPNLHFIIVSLEIPQQQHLCQQQTVNKRFVALNSSFLTNFKAIGQDSIVENKSTTKVRIEFLFKLRFEFCSNWKIS